MLCAISGEAPEVPVVSKKTGAVYEKRLIEKYIEEHGKEPGTDDELDVEDLLELKPVGGIVRPRPPTLTSIPALLATFQNEWDALALETYTLQQQLSQTRMELATALYQHDAAIRVIARLTKERDEARDSLSRVTVVSSSAAPAAGESMAVDSEELPEELAAVVDETTAKLSKSRKKRATPKGWASASSIASFEQLASDDLPAGIAPATAISLEATGSGYAAVAGLGSAGLGIYSIAAHKVERTIPVDNGAPVTAALWATQTKIVVGTSKGAIKVYEAGAEVASLPGAHAGAVTGLAVHPSGRIFASVGVDKTICLYDLDAGKSVSRAHSSSSLTSVSFHPDGHLLGVGTTAGDVQVYLVKTGDLATTFSLGAPVQALAFSENGYWIAATAKGQTTVTIFDLRKEGDAVVAKTLDVGSAVLSLAWDYSGQYLATGGPSGVTVQHYAKSSKKWAESALAASATPAVSVQWGPEAKQLLAVSTDGIVSVVGIKEE
ncbi:cell cycle control protein [Ophiostoma piceae UAMH 11346]|uniref:Pre-mRNA-processing factor 19 n=1 Tax=Ophiostoma piceae (strain UAMH 11346) TaxID=1262450 RepID=S3CJ57_OPHP1|nr:cell cycle control protein [Ophiostoma piceae UAMH 11346]